MAAMASSCGWPDLPDEGAVLAAGDNDVLRKDVVPRKIGDAHRRQPRSSRSRASNGDHIRHLGRQPGLTTNTAGPRWAICSLDMENMNDKSTCAPFLEPTARGALSKSFMATKPFCQS